MLDPRRVPLIILLMLLTLLAVLKIQEKNASRVFPSHTQQQQW